jgi:hypothetical protein
LILLLLSIHLRSLKPNVFNTNLPHASSSFLTNTHLAPLAAPTPMHASNTSPVVTSNGVLNNNHI